MIISDAHRLLFVHVQKTGGVTLTNLLLEQLPDVRTVQKRHAPLRLILDKEPGLADYWIFGFVRNPWDRMVSWWSMIDNWRGWNDRTGGAERPGAEQWNPFWHGVAAYTSFEQFLEEGTATFPRLRRNQVHYLTSPGRDADFVGRTERLAEDTAYALERVGLRADTLGHDNRSRRADYRSYYTPRTRDLVGEVFAVDVATYGYEF